MITRRMLAGLYLLLLLPITLQAQNQESVLMLDELIQKVLTQNPKLQSSYHVYQFDMEGNIELFASH